MLHLLIWNIKFFTKSRIEDTTGRTPAERIDNGRRALANLYYILMTVLEADPDIFVVIEPQSDQGNIEELAGGEGPLGLLFLLRQLRDSFSPNWYLVPPLRLNPRDQLSERTYTETVGVFWRNDRVNFTGPYLWPAARPNTGPPIAPGAGAAANAYPAPWDAAVPAGTNAAGRCRFYRADGSEIIFSEEVNRYTRRPFLTTFTELATGRGINLFALHTKPAGTNARTGVARISAIQPADWVPGHNDVTVFAGDLNINLFGMATGDRDVFNLLSFDGLHRLTPPTANHEQSRVLSRKFGAPTAYHYDELLDYGLVRYDPNAVPPALPANPAVVADRVAGVAAANGLPAFTTDMGTTLANIALLAASNLVNLAPAPRGAVRRGDLITVNTTGAHGVEPGNEIALSGVADASFNRRYMVTAAPHATRLNCEVKAAAPGAPKVYQPDAASGGGTLDTLPRLNTFRLRDNYGHICEPKSGTSDHLPVFMLI